MVHTQFLTDKARTPDCCGEQQNKILSKFKHLKRFLCMRRDDQCMKYFIILALNNLPPQVVLVV